MQLLHAVYLIEYALVIRLVVVDQELGPLVLLTSHHWMFSLWGMLDIVYQDVPTTSETMWQRITDLCAAMKPQVIE
jgi:hypothetical protein